MPQQPAYLCTAQQIRRADQVMIEQMGFPGLILMETAGRKAAEWLLHRYPQASARFLVLAGPGNNGGDGLVIARYLHLAGRHVEVLLSHDPERYQGDALANWKALQGANLTVHAWPCPIPGWIQQDQYGTVIIDALLGTGINSTVQGSIAEIIAAFSESKPAVVAIDLPSGLSADTGQVPNAVVRADATLTFQAPKVCHHLTPAADACGEVVTLDIGIWPKVMQGLGIRRFLLNAEVCAGFYRERPDSGHKGTFGHALTVGGSRAYAGAIALSSHAALLAGAGLSTVFTTESARCAVLPNHPELMVRAWGDPTTPWLTRDALPELLPLLQGKNALAIGPGLGNEPDTCDLLRGLLEAWGRPLVLDADGLNLLASEPELWRFVPRGSILTPHPGEMARLLPGRDIINRRLESAEHLAYEKQVIVVLKGAGTVVALPNGRTYVNTSGNAGMATGGAGDVLTGMIVGLLAQGYPPDQAALMGVYLHGRAGDLAKDAEGAEEAVTASSIAARIGDAFFENLLHSMS